MPRFVACLLILAALGAAHAAPPRGIPFYDRVDAKMAAHPNVFRIHEDRPIKTHCVNTYVGEKYEE